MSVTDKEIFDKFREMAGGKLTKEQVEALNAVIAAGQREEVIKAFAIHDDVYMTTSLKGMQIIAGFESYRSTAYKDSVGVWTIGFGTTVYPNSKKVSQGDTCTKEQALMWKAHDVAFFERHINRIITVPLKQNQFDAIVSLVYNIGVRAFEDGSVDNLINAGKIEEALTVWAKYNKGRIGGVLKPIAGLTNRRTAEIAHFKS